MIEATAQSTLLLWQRTVIVTRRHSFKSLIIHKATATADNDMKKRNLKYANKQSNSPRLTHPLPSSASQPPRVFPCSPVLAITTAMWAVLQLTPGKVKKGTRICKLKYRPRPRESDPLKMGKKWRDDTRAQPTARAQGKRKKDLHHVECHRSLLRYLRLISFDSRDFFS